MPDPAAVLVRCAAGEMSPALALTQLFLATQDEASARHALAASLAAAEGGARENLGQMAALWNESPGAFALVSDIARSADPKARSIEDWAQVFDGAATTSPEASVALYSFGRADLLAQATAELVALLEARGLLGLSVRVLDMGCGIGRIAAALAPKVASVAGVDISDAMIAQARRRVLAANVSFRKGNGRDLAFLADGAVDLALAVDVFPYLVAAGADVVQSNLRAVARVLRDGGRALIFNFSYRDDDAADTAEAAALAGEAGLSLEAVERPLRIWDGRLFTLRKRADQARP